MDIVINITIGVLTLAAGGALGYTQLHKRAQLNIERKREKAKELLEQAEKEAAEIKAQAKESAAELEKRADQNIEMNQKLIDQMESSLKNKESSLQKQEAKVNQTKLRIAEIEEETSAKSTQSKQLEKKFTEELAVKSGKSESETKQEIINKYDKDLQQENALHLARTVEQTKEKAPRIAQKIIVNAIQRLCSPTSVEPRAIHIKVPKDIIKGKIVGKGAQNILHFEELLNVDIVFNDLPKIISISAFNLVDRRIAQRAMETLVKAKGEISKKTIQDTVEKARKEIDKELLNIGMKMVNQIGLKNLDPELIRTIGRLQFRTSYSQNIMRHSMEVGYLATMMGSELGLDLRVCKIAGFLHDLGKAIDQNPDVQGTHDFLTKELMEKYGFAEDEIHAAWTHHESEKPSTPEALMVQAADALSASRPGARQESLEKYLERLHGLEAAASSFAGIKKAFAISAGREVRAIVDPTLIDDEGAQKLADQIAKKVESELTYPGKIKINVIRRTKTIEVAR